ncbi:MAG: hypothetical protein PHS04_00220 [Tissierellia bacterium]|nr:hypothetical protein [Tissierellia bacterium]
MNNFLNSAASRIVGCIGVVTLIGIMKWIFDDVFSTALITLVIIQWFIISFIIE